MSNHNIMDSIRSFFGLQPNPPRNDFRNPIWSSDDEDDGDELYTRQQIEAFSEAMDIHEDFRKQMHDMFKSFGSMFGEFKSFFQDDHIDAFTSMALPDNPESGNFADTDSNRIREYYLKPGYHSHGEDHPKEDIDLDGKISSNEISGLLKQKKDSHKPGPISPFNGNLVPGRSFCQTIITTSVTKPDGTVETRRIVKNGNEVIEETTTSTGPDTRGPHTPGLDQISSPGFIYNNLSSFFRNYH
ncbi:uncharacterized protein LOC142976683 [Anticarsia gemmatalis]|uniref:uncharacterized protein LOC142976683 n=1 Tax=Anticarsia gemmatalis TaxID=129554 RepID=UPI003F76847B